MTDKLEHVILESLIGSEQYCRDVIPYIKEEFFDDRIEKILFKEIERFFVEHNKTPTKKILKLFVEDSTEFRQTEYDKAKQLIDDFADPENNKEWLYKKTEEWTKRKAIYNAIMTSISIMDGKNDKLNPEAIPSLLQDALGVCFDKDVGHDLFSNASERYDFYHREESRIPFDLEMFNKITKGGLPPKTITCVVAGVNCVHPDTKVKIRIRAKE